MNKTKIESADFSWNPIVGCDRGCGYCYARKLNNRFKHIPDFTVPVFFEERQFDAIPKLPKVRNRIARQISPDKPVVFVCDMGDIFSRGVKEDWINAVVVHTMLHPEVEYMFLSKRPECYSEWVFGDNCWLGTTVEVKGLRARIDDLRRSNHPKLYVSIEPLLDDFKGVDFKGIGFAIVGKLTGKDSYPLETLYGFVDTIDIETIYLKDSMLNSEK